MKQRLKKLLYSAYASSGKNLAPFKNIHAGESCYIFGDGASIKWFDLARFSDKPAFILGLLFLHKKFLHIGRPIYGLLAEPYYFYSYFRLPMPPYSLWKNNIQRRYREVIRQHIDSQFFVSLSNYPVLRGPNVNYLFQSIPDSTFPIQCLSQNQNPMHGSLRVSITLAIFMGFSTIYLIGCDYTHAKSRSKHWYEFGSGVSNELVGYNKKFFDIAKKYVDIITVTLEGEGSLLSSIEYEKHTHSAPVYSENCDLVEMDDLLLLDTWPGYDVFTKS